jgi:hypothetical protein
MSVTLTITVQHCTPRDERDPTIWEALAERLGREPTRQEAIDEVKRILREASEERMVADPQRHLRRTLKPR